MEEKKMLRQLVRERWSGISAAGLEEASRRVMDCLESLPEFSAADTIALFWSMPHEVDTRPLIRSWSAHKRILLPVIEGEQLLMRPFTAEERMTRHSFGVWEPTDGEAVPLAEADLIVVPGAAFDPHGGRVGWGKGFYDRLLAETPQGLPRIGACYDFQLFDRVPRESHDIIVDKVIVGSDEAATLHISPQSRKS